MFLKLVRGITIVLVGVITITIGFLPLIKKDITDYGVISSFASTPDTFLQRIHVKQKSVFKMPFIFTKRESASHIFSAGLSITNDETLAKIVENRGGIVVQKLPENDYRLRLWTTTEINSDSVIVFDVPSIKDFKKYFEKVTDITQKSPLIENGIAPESWQCIGVTSIGSIGIVERFQSKEPLDTCFKKFAVNMQNQKWQLVEELKDGYIFRNEWNLCTFKAKYNSKNSKTEIIVVTSNKGIGG